MKKCIAVIILACLLVIGAACAIPYDKPYGTWHNSATGLTLDIFPVESGPHMGTYEINGNVLDVAIYFGHDKSFIIEHTSSGITEALFNGTFSIRNGELHYKLKKHWQELTDIRDNLIFVKVID